MHRRGSRWARFTAVLAVVTAFWLAGSVAVARELPKERSDPAETLAISPVTVVDVREGVVRPDMTVVVSGDRITAVGRVDSIEIPTGARVVDGTGKFLIPGLWDMHAHAARAGRAPRFWPRLVAHGVTGIREMGSHLDSLLHWRTESQREGALSPRIHWSGPMLDGSPPVWPIGRAVPDAEAARAAVDTMLGLGFDALKVYERLSGEAYAALAEEAGRRGIPFAGHVPLAVDPLEASDAGQRSLEHATDVVTACLPGGRALFRAAGGVGGPSDPGAAEAADRAMGKLMGAMALSGPDPELCGPLLNRLAADGTWFTPTLIQSRGQLEPSRYDDDPRLGAVPPEVAEAWHRSRGLDPGQEARIGRPILDNVLTVVGMAHRASVGILAGTDVSDEPYVFPGSSLHDELELLVEAGLPPAEALRAATLEPARYLEATDSLGTVEPGHLADLVLLGANPLEDISHTREIAAVFLDGRYLDREALNQLLTDAEGAARPAPPDTVRHTIMVGGRPSGERTAWREAPNVWHYAYHHSGGSPALDSRVVLGAEGLPVRLATTGEKFRGVGWTEHVRIEGDEARWSTPHESGETAVSVPTYYAAVYPAHDLGVLARALVRRPDRALPLLPDGEARLERLGTRTMDVEGRTRTVVHYAIHGLALAPQYVWLDRDGAFFAGYRSVLKGWEPAFEELMSASLDALAEFGRGLARDLVPPPRTRPLVIHGARLFDPQSLSVRSGTSIVVEGEHVTAVGPDGDVDVPAGAKRLDADGRMVLPGLWDMHVHYPPTAGWGAFPIGELAAPLHLAAGVTSVRTLGGKIGFLASLRRRITAGEAVGPRVFAAGMIHGPIRRSDGATVGDAGEARAAVDRFAELGYVQIKIYNSLPEELVPVVVERAKRHGMRVSGHIPNGMTGREAVESGFEELQHLFYVRVGAAGIRGLGKDEYVGARMAAVVPGTEPWQEFVDLLLGHDVVVDPTMAVVEEGVGVHPPAWLAGDLDRFPVPARRRLVDGAGPPAAPPMLREYYDEIVENGPALVRALHEAGVPLIAGTDASPGGLALQRELEIYGESGIPAPEVLRLATLGAARVTGRDDELGSVAPGKLADLILVDGDPTTDIRDIRRVVTVIKDGRVYDPAAIHRALDIEPCCVPEPGEEPR